MRAVFTILPPTIFWILIWVAGSGVQNRTESPLSFWIAIVALILIGLLAMIFAILSALALYSPEKNEKVRVQSGNYLAVWNPSKSQVISYAAASYGTTIYIFAVVFALIGTNDNHAFAPAVETIGTGLYFSIVTIATVG